MNEQMRDQMGRGQGFLAALDQSGGSTPKALALYGVEPTAYSDDEQMFDQMHAMRVRIMTDPHFTGERIVAAILFEQTMDRQVQGRPTPDYLWNVKNVVPLVKVDKGLADVANRQHHLTINDGIAQNPLTEILVKPTGAHHVPG